MEKTMEKTIRMVRWYVITLAVTGAAFFGGRAWTVAVLAQRGVEVTPYMIVQDTTGFKTGAATGVLEHRVLSRRRDGSTAMRGTFPAHPEAGALRRVELADGHFAMIAEAGGAKSTGLRTNAALAAWKSAAAEDPPPDCMYPSDTLLGRERVQGQDTAIVLRESGDTRVTEWRVRSLRCLDLRSRVERRTPLGSWELVAEKTTVALALGDPDDKQFDLEAGYAEMKPSALITSLAKDWGQTRENCPAWASMDAEYLKQQ